MWSRAETQQLMWRTKQQNSAGFARIAFSLYFMLLLSPLCSHQKACTYQKHLDTGFESNSAVEPKIWV